jgi:hypothetical protein
MILANQLLLPSAAIEIRVRAKAQVRTVDVPMAAIAFQRIVGGKDSSASWPVAIEVVDLDDSRNSGDTCGRQTKVAAEPIRGYMSVGVGVSQPQLRSGDTCEVLQDPAGADAPCGSDFSGVTLDHLAQAFQASSGERNRAITAPIGHDDEPTVAGFAMIHGAQHRLDTALDTGFFVARGHNHTDGPLRAGTSHQPPSIFSSSPT